jgi:hypothetical protein
MAAKTEFTLQVPLDASKVEGAKSDRKVKVAVQNARGEIQSKVVGFDERGNGSAQFAFEEKPGRLTVAVGPHDASDTEIFGLQTLQAEVPRRRWSKAQQVILAPIHIPPYHWHWWLRWCRTFTVRGRVLCPDGRPAVGAKVCAYDVDAWWWWSSKQLVGCDTTDLNGAFEFQFRWCCGWWPWWWWRMRAWHLDTHLLEKISPVLALDPKQLRPIPLPDPAPDLRIFERLLGEDAFNQLNLARSVTPHTALADHTMRAVVGDARSLVQKATTIHPNALTNLREPLLARLPYVEEFSRLHIWPWWPWQPWWDCTPDIIFRVTQDCVQPGTVIFEEGYFQARWNIPTTLNVTLTANNHACCIGDDPDDPEGDCAVLTDVCNDPINIIGGNPGAGAVPIGYLNPGLVATGGDRPYAGNVLIQGQVGDAVDYYEFQWSDDGGATWNDMQNTAVGDIPRQYWEPATNTFQSVPFLAPLDGRLVFESRLHYEATHGGPGVWDVTRFWMASNYLSLMNWLTETPFLNGTYRLRIKGWHFVNGHLAPVQNLEFLPTCSLETPAELVLRIDNRIKGAGSGHVLADPHHRCGADTVHTCTLEPDTDFLGVRILRPNGEVVAVNACGNVPIGRGDRLQVDFLAHDPEGHLAFYSLQVTHGENLVTNLLALGGALTPFLGGAPVPAADQVGPNYHQARLDGAVSPIWHGGAIRFEVAANLAFPETCCYQLELRAHKRTVVDCGHSFWGQTNYSEYSFMIVV